MTWLPSLPRSSLTLCLMRELDENVSSSLGRPSRVAGTVPHP